MRILFDQGTPAPLIPFLVGHTVTKARDMGWDKLANGELLAAAEEAGFEVLARSAHVQFPFHRDQRLYIVILRE